MNTELATLDAIFFALHRTAEPTTRNLVGADTFRKIISDHTVEDTINAIITVLPKYAKEMVEDFLQR